MYHKYKETYEFIHGDILIYVRIDYVNNDISLLEKNGQDFKQKKWLFAGRGVEYVNGWKNILKAMELAMDDAKKRYEENLAKESELRTQEHIEVLENIYKPPNIK